MKACSTCQHSLCSRDDRDPIITSPIDWTCTHSACIHPVTGAPLACSTARAPIGAPHNIHGVEFCGPDARHHRAAA